MLAHARQIMASADQADPEQSRPAAEPAAPSAGVPAAPGPSPGVTSDTPSAAKTPSPAVTSGQADERLPGLPAQEETQEVVTDLFRAVLTNRGGEITRWELRRYTNPGPNGPVPVQLIHREGKFQGPLSIRVADPAIAKQLAGGV